MPLSEHDHDITRRYLLGQLTDEEEQSLEERLLTEDDFFQEVELTKDELAQEYASGELTAKERKWLQQNFLASPEGKQRHEFAKTFDRYVRSHRVQRKSPNLIERLRTLWNTQPQLLTAASTAGVLVVAVIIYSVIPPTSTPRTFADLTVTHSTSTRSTDTAPGPSITLREDALRLKLMLPQATSPGSTFRVAVRLSNSDAGETFKPSAQDTQSITVEIPASQLPPNLYVAEVSIVDANGNAQKIPGVYTFKVE